jgi:hypothetical protein
MCVTTGPLERSNCQIHLRPLSHRSDSGKSRLGPASRDAGLKKDRRFFVQLDFTQCNLFCREGGEE